MPLFSISRITCQAQKFAQAETGKAAHLGHPVPKVSIQKPPTTVLYNNVEATIVWTKEEMNASFKPLELAVIVQQIPCPEKGFYAPSINQRDPTLEHNNPQMGEITINSADRILEKLSTERTKGTKSLRSDSIQDLDYSEEFAGMVAFSEDDESNAELFEEEGAEEHVSGAPSSRLVLSASAVPFIPLNVKSPPPFLLEEIHGRIQSKAILENKMSGRKLVWPKTNGVYSKDDGFQESFTKESVDRGFYSDGEDAVFFA
ncbi:unnamed protein product [Ilex paraguariensis]|uniref:Uncharacterized protein n=1 Tax=Ilex paraguariensis TaxID=185542 RepID=A0ABC8RNY4_9AQUA